MSLAETEIHCGWIEVGKFIDQERGQPAYYLAKLTACSAVDRFCKIIADSFYLISFR